MTHARTCLSKAVVVGILVVLGILIVVAVLVFFLAHLSRRLIGELIVYQCSGVRRRRRRRRRRPQFQTSSPKPQGRLKPNFMWSLLG